MSTALDDPLLALQFLLKHCKNKVAKVADLVQCHRSTIYRMKEGENAPSRLVRREIVNVAKELHAKQQRA